jgi:hypothetical protein
LEAVVSQLVRRFLTSAAKNNVICMFPTASHLLPATLTLIGPINTRVANILKIDFDVADLLEV